jgi:hypothetical protein
MNYSKHYEALIAKAKARGKPEGYAERHHVVPRSLGGSNSRNNLVWLTAREHFIAHVLLEHVHGGPQWYAVMMFAAEQQRVINSRLYNIAKRNKARSKRSKKRRDKGAYSRWSAGGKCS